MLTRESHQLHKLCRTRPISGQQLLGIGGSIHVGTSGFSYRDWAEKFYPTTVKPGQRLAFYSTVFDTLVDSLSLFLRRLPSHDVETLLPRDVPALVKIFPVLRRVVRSAGRVMVLFSGGVKQDDDAKYKPKDVNNEQKAMLPERIDTGRQRFLAEATSALGHSLDQGVAGRCYSELSITNCAASPILPLPSVATLLVCRGLKTVSYGSSLSSGELQFGPQLRQLPRHFFRKSPRQEVVAPKVQVDMLIE